MKLKKKMSKSKKAELILKNSTPILTLLLRPILLILIITLLVSITAISTMPEVQAEQAIKVIRETQNQVAIRVPFNIEISVFNSEEQSKVVAIEERIPKSFELINPNEPTITKNYNGIQVNFLKWELTIPAKSSKSVIYTIKPTQPGDITLTPTKVTDNLTQEVYQTAISQLIIKCNNNQVCEPAENYLNCPEDCPTGSKDGICDYMADEVCDPDCTQDPDCTLLNKINLNKIISVILLVFIIFMLIKFVRKKKKRSHY